MSTPPRRAPIPPLSGQLTGSVQEQIIRLANAISGKADLQSEPVFSAVLLVAPGGAVWRVSVDDSGAVLTAEVPRS